MNNDVSSSPNISKWWYTIVKIIKFSCSFQFFMVHLQFKHKNCSYSLHVCTEKEPSLFAISAFATLDIVVIFIDMYLYSCTWHLIWKVTLKSIATVSHRYGGVSIGPFTLAKTQIQKTWVFCCTLYTARKTHNIRGLARKAHARKNPNLILVFLVSGAHARLLSTFDRARVVRITSRRGRVIPLKNPNNTGEIRASVYIGKKPVKFRRSFKKSCCGGGFFDSGFLECLGGSCLATFNEKPECEKDSGFFMPV